MKEELVIQVGRWVEMKLMELIVSQTEREVFKLDLKARYSEYRQPLFLCPEHGKLLFLSDHCLILSMGGLDLF